MRSLLNVGMCVCVQAGSPPLEIEKQKKGHQSKFFVAPLEIEKQKKRSSEQIFWRPPPPLEIEKQKNKSSEQILRSYTYILPFRDATLCPPPSSGVGVCVCGTGEE